MQGGLEQPQTVLQEVYAAGTIEDEQGRKLPISPVGIDAAQASALSDLVSSAGAVSTIETGFALGLSAAHIAIGLLRSEQPGVQHVAIDPTERSLWGNAGVRLLERAGLSDVVELLEEDSHVALPSLLREERSFDLAFVDGGHHFDAVLIDLYWLTRLVKPGGLVVIDDMWMPAVRLAVAYVEANFGAELLPDAIRNGFRWSRGNGPSSDVRPGHGQTAVLRVPPPQHREWDHFVPFW
jgi:predicted O-methyltransferase YrrM